MKSKLKKEAKEKHFRVAVFGSARIKKNGLEYKLIYKLAKMVAAENIDIVTGGGQGLMAAASSGHHAGRKNRKVHSIGLKKNFRDFLKGWTISCSFQMLL